MRLPGRLGFAALLASGALAAASVASAGNRPVNVKGCENVATGAIRLPPSHLRAPFNTSCHTTTRNPVLLERPITWNQPGAAGPAGPAGGDGKDGMSSLSQALANGDPESGSGGSSFTAASGVTYACTGAPGADGTQGAAGAQGLKGDATADTFSIGIIPTGTAFDGTHMWVITNPNPGVIELHPDGTTAGPSPAGGGPPGSPLADIYVWVSGVNGVTELNPGGTTAGPFSIGIIPTGTAFDGTHMWVITSPNPGVIELHPDGTFPGRGQATRDRVRRHPHVGVLV